MHKIESENGKFSHGDPTGPEIKEATVLSADWLNAIQDELVHTIEQAGIQLDKSDNKQLVGAITTLIESKITKSNQDLDTLWMEIYGEPRK